MKTGTIIFLFFTLLSNTTLQAQNYSFFSLFDSTRRTVELPVSNYYPDTAVVIKSEAAFNSFFKEYNLQKLPVVDFTVEYLQLCFYCHYCSSHCNHASGICHRNACSRTPVWVVVKKE